MLLALSRVPRRASLSGGALRCSASDSGPSCPHQAGIPISSSHQLCATATVVGASAVGLSFGREAPLNASNKRKATPARELHHPSMPSQVHSQATTTTTTTAAQHHSSPIPLAAPSRAPFVTRVSYDGRPRRIVRRMTSADPPHTASASAVNGYVPGGEADVDELDPVALASSRRASWIKRLSNISTSQPSSRNTSPGPLSPSVSCSNGSMAFSHDGSTAPMIGERPPPPLPPNKLVKRSSSVHVSRETSTQGSGSRLPSFRRPATSHQRSATLQHRTALLEMTAENPSADVQPLPPSTDSDVEYAQFFTARVADEKALGKRKGSLVNAKALRRIYPDETHKPTLLLATSVSAGADAEVDESASEDGESMFFVSRPGTPLSFTAVIATQNEKSQDSRPSRHRPSVDNDDAARPRRSFSIADLLSPVSSAKKQRTVRLPGAKLARRISQRRVSSAPLPTMTKRQSSTAHGDPSASSARRDLTDPTLLRRNISTSAGAAESGTLRNGPSRASSSSPLPALLRRASGMAERAPASMHQSDVKPPVSISTNQMPPSPTLAQTSVRPSRHSMAPSEQASTLVGSDNEARGVGTGDEDDADVQSETVFDSLRTGATRSTAGGARGPRIETIFDESPPSKVKVTALRDLLPKGTFREQTADAAPGQHSIAEEEESISTPVRTIVPDRSIQDSPSFSRGPSAPLFPNLIPSSPPDMPKPLSLGTLEWDVRGGDDDSSSRWSMEEEDEDSWSELPSRLPATHFAPASRARHNPRLFASGSSPKPTTPQHLTVDNGDRDARSSIFDWSEQQPTDKSSGNRTPPRPSTVHGKKDADRRGSRSVGRRAPSGLHARSQSVPVVPDATGKRNTVVTNKFGTWGVGSKGVTEDWNDDFDFSDLHEEPRAEGAAESQRVDSGTAMVVPNHIQQQQSNVLANIGLLREWGLLIEELKEQRVRAVSLGIVAGSRAGMWEEVDAMIDLADQEAEHEGIPGLSPPSSPAFDEDAFDDVSGSSPNHSRETRRSGLASEELGNNKSKNNAHLSSQPTRPRRKSILPPNYHFQGPQSSPMPPKSKYESPTSPAEQKTIMTRPRKDSEAKARSVIEALQNRRNAYESPADAQPPSPTKKVPFDTATLRRIVPYVNTLTRRVKDALRDAEGLYSSPSTSPSKDHEPPFSKIFQTDNDLPKQMKLMTVM
ncbi:hypothetical protein K458DRAFT_399046 [Lentithecium fluviatile CBS 122367]|uniref:Uncharacterized protein n=1 Tax=Lentithecium fluviatile CBS 122367 TaxID=1168545 RepID=A0A6G1JKW5_9PLEO|nr:hypothetical protein K458DRAFT_399046 [Lentithecium fluviatile CBS 122367]